MACKKDKICASHSCGARAAEYAVKGDVNLEMLIDASMIVRCCPVNINH